MEVYINTKLAIIILNYNYPYNEIGKVDISIIRVEGGRIMLYKTGVIIMPCIPGTNVND